MQLHMRTAIVILLGAGLSMAGQDCKGNAVFQVHLENVEVTKKEAAEYKPGLRDFYVRDFNDSQNIYLKALPSKLAESGGWGG